MPMEMNDNPKIAKKKAGFMVSLGMLFAFVGILLVWSAFGIHAQGNADATATSLMAIGGAGHILFGIFLIMLSNIKILLLSNQPSKRSSRG